MTETKPDRILYLGYDFHCKVSRDLYDTSKPFAKVEWYKETDTYVYRLLGESSRTIAGWPDGLSSVGWLEIFSARVFKESKGKFQEGWGRTYPLTLDFEPRTYSYDEYLASFGATRETYHPFDELHYRKGRRMMTKRWNWRGLRVSENFMLSYFKQCCVRMAGMIWQRKAGAPTGSLTVHGFVRPQGSSLTLR